MIDWLAAGLGAAAVYLAWPSRGLGRLTARAAPVLPAWAAPCPGALPTRTRWWLSGLAGLALVWFGWGTAPWLVGLVPLVVVGGWWLLGRLEGGTARRARLADKADLPYALDLIRLGVGAGQPLRTALATAAEVMGGRVATTLDRVARGVAVGLSDAEAWQALSDDPAWRDIARDIARAADWGVRLTDVLDQHAAQLRRQVKADRLAAAKAVGVKAVAPLGLCYLPAFVCLGVVPVIVGGVLVILH